MAGRTSVHSLSIFLEPIFFKNFEFGGSDYKNNCVFIVEHLD